MYQVRLSAETKANAENILKILVKEKLLVWWTILNWPSLFNRKWKIVEMDYHYIMWWTSESIDLTELEKLYSKSTIEEIPMMSLQKVISNSIFEDYVSKNTK